MTDQPQPPPAGWPPQAGWPPRGAAPSGLFPSGPPRPTYREPHPVRGSAVAVGLGAGTLWMLFFGLLGGGLRAYAWWTVIAGAAAWLVALGLARYGDRGVAAGVSIATGAAMCVGVIAVAVRWAVGGDWPLW